MSGPSAPGPVSLARNEKAENYVSTPELDAAIDVAKLLHKPLLVTGEAGVGKTRLADYIVQREGLPRGKPLKFETKSVSTGQDLFYIYNTLARFQDVQLAGAAASRNFQTGTPAFSAPEPREYITYRALGEAIIRTHPFPDVEDVVPAWMRKESWEKPEQSLVLIDEIDKAPQDFPNDILNEIEHYFFRIPELGNRTIECASDDLRPFVLLTSNSEKTLPDPFLRRCVYFHIQRPGMKQLREIVLKRITLQADRSDLLEDALMIFSELRGDDLRLDHPIGVAELLDWLIALGPRIPPGKRLRGNYFDTELRQTLCALVKAPSDREKAEARLGVKGWLKPTG